MSPRPVFQNAEAVTAEDLAAVHALIGRKPKTAFTVVVRRVDGMPVVTRNAPLEADGTPMPTRYWLLPSALANHAIGRIESTGGVRRAEIEIAAEVIEAVHQAYAEERDSALPLDWRGHVQPVELVEPGRASNACMPTTRIFWQATMMPLARGLMRSCFPKNAINP